MLETYPTETAALLDEIEPTDSRPADPRNLSVQPALWAIPPEAPLTMPEQGF